MGEIMKQAQKEDRTVTGPLQVAKSSASGEFSRPVILQKVAVMTRGFLLWI